MKKILFTVIFTLSILTVLNAQNYKWWAGGHTTFWTGKNSTTFIVAPEVGYHLTPQFTLAASLGYHSYKYDNTKFNFKPDFSGFVLNPYVRYTIFKQGIVLGFVDGGVDLGLGDLEGVQLGFKPGIAILLSDRFTAATQFGFIGYNDGRDIGDRRKGFGFDLSGYCPIIAFFYSF